MKESVGRPVGSDRIHAVAAGTDESVHSEQFGSDRIHAVKSSTDESVHSEQAALGLENPCMIRALEEYRVALETGCKPDRDEFVARYPEIAQSLADCLDGLEFVHLAIPEFGQPPVVDPVASSGAILPEAPLGDFRIVREIGRGGMGVVYEAVQISLGRRVALKVLPFASTLDAKQLQRFKNEAQAAAHLHHQNIVPVYATGCERGVHFYAMQFIEGQTLAALIRDLRQQAGKEERGARSEERGAKKANGAGTIEDRGPTNETKPGRPLSSILYPPSSFFRTAAQLGVQAALALEHAHQLGVVHRDIKPANLLVDARGNLWITDFGLAHCQSQAGLTMTGDLAGTLRYMSPEQALAKRGVVDHRTDVYSLGVTLYELLTLEPAFNGRDRQELLGQITVEEPKPPRRLNPAIPAELETIVLKAIEKNPVDRYATAQELADDLERFLKDEPIRAKRPTLRKRLLKWARRHQAVVLTVAVATAVLVLMALFVLAVSYTYVSREKNKKEAAIREKDQALRQAQDNAQAAEANLQLARKAVDEIHEQLANKSGNLPQLQALEEAFLQQALLFYRQFAQRNSTDPGIRLGLARIYRRVGLVRLRLNRYQQAEQALMQAVALLEGLVADDPSDPRYRAELATTHCKLDFVLGETKGTLAAEQSLRRAVALFTQLVAEHPDAEYRKSLAGAQISLGARLQARPQEAEKAHQLAITLLEQLVAEFPKQPTVRGELVRAHYFLGQARAQAGQFQEAEKSYRGAIVVYEQQADTLNSSWHREILPNAHFELAKVLHALDRLQEAEDQYGLAIVLYEKEVAEFPRTPHRWYKLYDCYPMFSQE